jgi:Lon protease-like protein
VPFDAHHVMLPGEEKTLHLFEARYLALFDEAVLNYQKRFGHILLSHERSALAASGTLVQVSSFERMEIGVKLQIHGIGRIQVSAVELSGSAPYILGSVAYVEDVDEEEEPQQDVDELLALEETFWRGALRLVDLSVELGLEPFRSKRHTIPPTISYDAFGATGSPPPGDGSDAAAKKARRGGRSAHPSPPPHSLC